MQKSLPGSLFKESFPTLGKTSGKSFQALEKRGFIFPRFGKFIFSRQLMFPRFGKIDRWISKVWKFEALFYPLQWKN